MKLVNLEYRILIQPFMQHVFVYGSLLFPEIVKGLTGRSFQTKEAMLNGYHRCAVKDADYPAIVERPGSQVNGKILLNLDNRSYEILRFFEGDEYQCVKVDVQTANGKFSACVFVWVGVDKMLEQTDWNPELFRENGLADYIDFIIPRTVREFERLFL